MRLFRSGDGSPGVLDERLGEAQHARDGAFTQARELYLRASGTHRHPAPRILELGFGAGLNFAVTLADARRRDAWLDYWALEAHPLPLELLEAVLGRFEPEVFAALAPGWGRSLRLAGCGFRLRLEIVDVRAWKPPAAWASAVYFDPFSPRTNPEAWERPVLAAMKRALQPGGVLVTYSVARPVREALESLGFRVERLRGRGRKRHWLRARRAGP